MKRLELEAARPRMRRPRTSCRVFVIERHGRLPRDADAWARAGCRTLAARRRGVRHLHLAFLAVASPWLSGVVTIPWDAVSQFYPQFAFLARSFAPGQSPFWTPNVFAGWPQIADPQSLVFSPLHLLVALFNPTPSSRACSTR